MPQNASTASLSGVSRKSPTYLFDLVNSLSKAEKRYLKIELQKRNSPENELSLNVFDYLVTQDAYDESHLISRLAVPANKLPKLKTRLYTFIMNLLQVFHRNDDGEMKVINLMQQAKILYNKGLYEQARSAVSKSRKLATELELVYLQGRINEWDKRLALKTAQGHEELKAGYAETQLRGSHALGYLEVRERLDQVAADVYGLFSLEGRIARSPAVINEIEGYVQYMEQELQSVVDGNLELTLTYNRALYTSMMMLDRGSEANKCSQESINLLQHNQHRLVRYSENYLHAHNQLIISHNQEGDFKGALKTIAGFREMAQEAKAGVSPAYEATVFDYTAFHELESLIGKSDLSGIARVLPLLEKRLMELGKKLNPVNRESKMYRLALGYFELGDYTRALRKLQMLDNGYKVQFRHDVRTSCKVLALFCHYALGNYGVLERLVPALAHYLEKEERLFEAEKLVIQFFKSVAISTPKEEKAHQYVLVHSLHALLKSRASERHVLAYYNLPHWLENHRV